MTQTALIVGASGVIGSALSRRLLADGWHVLGLSRGRAPLVPGVRPVQADLADPVAVAAALASAAGVAGVAGAAAATLQTPSPGPISQVFFCAWSRQATERENIGVNGAIVSNVLDALAPGRTLRHVALVTGLKHYLGPFEAYATGAVPVTPFREEQGRQPVDNFYYEQEDRLFAQAQRHDFSWSVHRPHTIIGHALGNAMNMGLTLAVYATLCKASGEPFAFPGSAAQWHGLTDMTDARLLARHLAWAATDPAAANQAFNVVNGDVFRWKWLWPRLADYFGIEAAPFDGVTNPLAPRMPADHTARRWAAIAAQHGLAEPDIGRLASWWHTDADLGRPMEVMADMSKSRKAGFLDYQDTPDAFSDLFDQLKAERIIPA